MFERFNGNVVPFADESTSTNRTVFGSEAQSDDIDDNLNSDFKKGWEIVGLNDNPTREDFNAMGYTLGYLTSYLYQNGVAEYSLLQEYKTNSIAIGTDGNIYQSLIDNNIGNALTDTTKWVCIASKNSIVNSIAELKTISNIESINVLGYYEKGDGGGSVFYWDATSTEADNGGTIIQATGVATGRWKRVFSGPVNVKWFGAVDSTDSTIYIQNAIDYCESIFSIIKITLDLNGLSYNISSTLKYNSAKVSIANGKLYSLSSGTYANNAMIELTTDNDIVTLASYTNIIVPVFNDLELEDESGTLDCIYAYDSTDSNNSAVTLHNVYNVRFTNFNKIFKNGQNGWGWNWFSCGARNCNYWLYLENAANTYERFSFFGCIFQNGGKVLYINNPNGKVYFYGCSIDYCIGLGDIVKGYVSYDGHIEFDGTNRITDWCTLGENSKLTLSGCLAIRLHTSSTSYYLVNQTTINSLDVTDLTVLSDGSLSTTNNAKLSNLQFTFRNIQDNGGNSAKYFFVDRSLDLNDYHAEVYVTNSGSLTLLQTSTNITVTSNEGAGASKGLTLYIPLSRNDVSKVAYSFTANNTSSNITYVNKYASSLDKKTIEQLSVGDIAIPVGTSTIDTDAQAVSLKSNTYYIVLSFNLNGLANATSLVISNFKFYEM